MIYIELILATAFVLFLLSSLVSGINELCAMLLNKRGREMRRALRNAFPELDDEMMRSLYNHPLIAPLKEPPKWDSLRGGALKLINFFRVNKFNHDFLPSYIDSKLLSRALADVLVLGNDLNAIETDSSDEIKQIYTCIETLDESNFSLFKDMYLSSSLQNKLAQGIWETLNTDANSSFEESKSKVLKQLRERMSIAQKLNPELQNEALMSRMLVHSGTEQPSTTDFLARESNNLDSWLENTSNWIDGYMDRVSGWYKKRSHTNIFWWSLILVITFNFNLLDFMSEIYRDQSLRQFWVEGGVKLAESSDPETHIKEFVDPLKDLLNFQWTENIWASLPGWLISVFAISLGAPFWFDVLGKVSNLRAAGKKKNDK